MNTSKLKSDWRIVNEVVMPLIMSTTGLMAAINPTGVMGRTIEVPVTMLNHFLMASTALGVPPLHVTVPAWGWFQAILGIITLLLFRYGGVEHSETSDTVPDYGPRDEWERENL